MPDIIRFTFELHMARHLLQLFQFIPSDLTLNGHDHSPGFVFRFYSLFQHFKKVIR